MKRYRSRSKFLALTNEQTEKLIGWLIVERVTYGEACARTEKEFGLKTSESAMSGFWKRFCEPRILNADLIAKGKVLLDLEIKAPTRLRVIQFGAQAVVALGEEGKG